MNRIIIPTGYMGSGSSAITDLISEMEGYDADSGSFEYVFLHCPNGIFDLEDKLLIGNNAIRSDEALHSFRHTMKQLYNKKYWWVGHYNEKLSTRFMEYTNEYLESIIQFYPAFYWYYQENTNLKMIIKLVLKRIVSLCTLGKVKLKKPLLYEDMSISYIEPEVFYEKTKVYLRKLWKELGIDSRNIILDQLLLPHNLYRINRYFEINEVEIFVVERDPRDMFIINKYICSKIGDQVPYPIDAQEFCKCYRALRKMEKVIEHSNIHRIRFEDLIYKYEDTVEYIMECLDVSPEKHIRKKMCFDPNKSIENTQIFLSKESYKMEVKIIEKELKEYLYDFPYKRKPDSSKSF